MRRQFLPAFGRCLPVDSTFSLKWGKGIEFRHHTPTKNWYLLTTPCPFVCLHCGLVLDLIDTLERTREGIVMAWNVCVTEKNRVFQI